MPIEEVSRPSTVKATVSQIFLYPQIEEVFQPPPESGPMRFYLEKQLVKKAFDDNFQSVSSHYIAVARTRYTVNITKAKEQTHTCTVTMAHSLTVYDKNLLHQHFLYLHNDTTAMIPTVIVPILSKTQNSCSSETFPLWGLPEGLLNKVIT